MELRNRNLSIAFCSHFSASFDFSAFFHIFHIFRIFSHFQNSFFHIFFQVHFQNAFFSHFFIFQKNVKNVKKCEKMRFENATRKKMWKNVFWTCTWKNAKNVQKMRKMRTMWKKRLKIQLGRWNSDFFSSGLIFWVPVLLQLLCCLPNLCRLKIGEEQFKSIGSGLCRSQIC